MIDPVIIVRGLDLGSTAVVAGLSGAEHWLHRKGGTKVEIARARNVALAAGACALAAHGLVMAGRAASMLEVDPRELGWAEISLITGQTWFGRVWVTQAAGLLSAVALQTVGFPRAACMLALGAIAISPLASHVFANETGWLPEIANLLHVLLAGVWFSGLAAIVFIRYAQGDKKSTRQVDALWQFSSFAFPAMLIVVGSGCLLAWSSTRRWASLFGTAYGQILLTKLLAVTLVLLCAAWMRRSLLPRARLMSDASPFVTTLQSEFALACLVLVLAGALSQSVPAMHADIAWRLPFRLMPEVAWARPEGPYQIIAGLLTFGLALVGSVVLSFRRPQAGFARGAMLTSSIAAVGGAALVIKAVAVAAYPTTYAMPPITYAADQIVAGKRLFVEHCVACHGITGRGDGPLASTLHPPPADLTAPHTADHTAGDMFWWLKYGIARSAMPGFGDRLDDTARWQLIMYLMALSHGYQGRLISEQVVLRQPWLPAIDFRYDPPWGDASSLLELRGKRSQFLVLADDPAAARERIELLKSRAQDFSAAGADVVVVERGTQAVNVSRVVPSAWRVVTDPDGAIGMAWGLYRRTFQHPDARDDAATPALVEFLIDRFGFVRARWRADEGSGFATPQQLINAITQIADEPEIRTLDEHFH